LNSGNDDRAGAGRRPGLDVSDRWMDVRWKRAARCSRPLRIWGWLWLALLCLLSSPAGAAVQMSFHSKDLGATFPHAFIAFEGTLDATGERVSGNYGFTVRHLLGPSVLLGPVQGTMISEGAAYVAGSNHHFTLTLTDDQYRAVMRLVERWRALPQPSYSLARRNCVTFVAEVAILLGLTADTRGLMRRPRAFLDRVRRENAPIIAAFARSAGQPAAPAR
jgi:hypothetical protein